VVFEKHRLDAHAGFREGGRRQAFDLAFIAARRHHHARAGAFVRKEGKRVHTALPQLSLPPPDRLAHVFDARLYAAGPVDY
jgi:hypothetical protein